MKPYYLLLATALTVAPAYAIEIDFSQPILDQNGQTQKDCDHVDNTTDPKTPICDRFSLRTLGSMAAAAIDQFDQGAKASDIIHRGYLASQIRKAIEPKPFGTGRPSIDIDPTDIDLIIDKLATLRLPPSQVGQAVNMMRPPVPPGKP